MDFYTDSQGQGEMNRALSPRLGNQATCFCGFWKQIFPDWRYEYIEEVNVRGLK
jgi:hypothetical protein